MLPGDVDEQEFDVLVELFNHNAKKGKKQKNEMSADEFFGKHGAKAPEPKKHVARTTLRTSTD